MKVGRFRGGHVTLSCDVAKGLEQRTKKFRGWIDCEGRAIVEKGESCDSRHVTL